MNNTRLEGLPPALSQDFFKPVKWSEPAWCGDHINLPYIDKGRGPNGWDCWGLLRRIYEREAAVFLPCHSENYVSSCDGHSIQEVVLTESQLWEDVTDQPKCVGDVVMLKILGTPQHCGMIVSKLKFIHTLKGLDSVLEDLESKTWNKRIINVYRYAHQH